MVSLKLQHIILSVDLLTFKKKKLILKSLQKLQIKVLGMQIISNKAFNGVRLAKRRRI